MQQTIQKQQAAQQAAQQQAALIGQRNLAHNFPTTRSVTSMCKARLWDQACYDWIGGEENVSWTAYKNSNGSHWEFRRDLQFRSRRWSDTWFHQVCVVPILSRWKGFKMVEVTANWFSNIMGTGPISLLGKLLHQGKKGCTAKQDLIVSAACWWTILWCLGEV